MQVKASNALSVPVLVTEQYPKALGATVPELKELLHASAPIVAKTRFSMVTPEVQEFLSANHGIKQVGEKLTTKGLGNCHFSNDPGWAPQLLMVARVHRIRGPSSTCEPARCCRAAQGSPSRLCPHPQALAPTRPNTPCAGAAGGHRGARVRAADDARPAAAGHRGAPGGGRRVVAAPQRPGDRAAARRAVGRLPDEPGDGARHGGPGGPGWDAPPQPQIHARAVAVPRPLLAPALELPAAPGLAAALALACPTAGTPAGV